MKADHTVNRYVTGMGNVCIYVGCITNIYNKHTRMYSHFKCTAKIIKHRTCRKHKSVGREHQSTILNHNLYYDDADDE